MAAFALFWQVLYCSCSFFTLMDSSCLFLAVVVGSGVSCGSIYRILHYFRCWSLVIACFRWLLPVQDAFSCFCMVVAD